MKTVAMNGSMYVVGWGLLLLLWLGLALASPAQSQLPMNAQPQIESPRNWAQESGFRFGLFMSGTGIGTESAPSNANPDDLYIDDEGGGMSLMLGYSVSRRVNLNLSLSASSHETTQSDVDAYYSSAIFEVHFQLLPEERVRPYLIGGLGGVGMGVDADEFETEIKGDAVVLGVGMLWNITDHLLLDSSLRLDFIDWDEVTFSRKLSNGQEIALASPVDDEGGAGHFQLGLTWAF